MSVTRQAPPVEVQGQGGAFWRVLGVGLPALAAGSLGAWGLLMVGLDDLWAWVGASKLAALAAAGLSLRRPRRHRLGWDGRQWQVNGHAAQVQLMLDLGPWLLLRVQAGAAAGPRWLPLAASEAGPAWAPLRTALYARDAGRPQPEQLYR